MRPSIAALLLGLVLAPPAQADTLWHDGFEGRMTAWKRVGSSQRTDVEAWQGRKSLTFRKVSGDGDAVSHAIRVEPGRTYHLHLAYLTRGGGGYVGVEQLDERGRKLTARWLIGDGGCCTEHVWGYAVGTEDAAALGRWEARSVPYENPGGVHFVRIILEDWSGGLPDDPEEMPVFVDAITLSTLPGHHSGCEDPDRDGHCAGHDNCSTAMNPTQRDRDLDGLGDACDPDKDGDGQVPPRDCDDHLASVHLGAPERCDDLDSDCDGSLVDEFPDEDGDGEPDCEAVVETASGVVLMPVPDGAFVGPAWMPHEDGLGGHEAEPIAAEVPPPAEPAEGDAVASAAPAATPSPPPAGYMALDEYEEPEGRSPRWPWLAAGMLLGTVSAALAVRPKRRRRPTDFPGMPEERPSSRTDLH